MCCGCASSCLSSRCWELAARRASSCSSWSWCGSAARNGEPSAGSQVGWVYSHGWGSWNDDLVLSKQRHETRPQNAPAGDRARARERAASRRQAPGTAIEVAVTTLGQRGERLGHAAPHAPRGLPPATRGAPQGDRADRTGPTRPSPSQSRPRALGPLRGRLPAKGAARRARLYVLLTLRYVFQCTINSRLCVNRSSYLSCRAIDTCCTSGLR
ncbi:hypothetical protein FOCC_FOCC016532, partial [Frankliniella occidentalis]